jgi:hypothetical protein
MAEEKVITSGIDELIHRLATLQNRHDHGLINDGIFHSSVLAAAQELEKILSSAKPIVKQETHKGR